MKKVTVTITTNRSVNVKITPVADPLEELIEAIGLNEDDGAGYAVKESEEVKGDAAKSESDD
jgi:hypothetical protein